MNKHISYSQIRTFRTCPMQWYFRYVENLKIPPGIAMVTGSGFHKALEKNFRSVIDNAMPLTTEEVLDAFSDSFESAPEIYYPPEEKAEGVKKVKAYHKDGGIRATKKYHEELSPKVVLLKPRDTEKFIELEVKKNDEQVIIKSVLDLVAEKTLIDFKLSQKKSASFDPTQLLLYSRGFLAEYGYPPEELRYDNAVYTKTNTALHIFSSPPLKFNPVVFDEIFAMAKAIDAGVFYPCSQDSWCCQPKWCGYFDSVCPYGAKRKVTFTIEES